MTSAISRNPQKTRPFHLTLRHSGLPRRRRNLQLQSMRSAIHPSPFFSSAALRRKKTDTQHGTCSCPFWPRRHKADGGQEVLDGCWVSLPLGLPGGGVTFSYRACVRGSTPALSSLLPPSGGKKKTRNTAPVAVSLGPAGIKPTEAKKYSISQGFSPDGLRRSAFNSTPGRWGLCR